MGVEKPAPQQGRAALDGGDVDWPAPAPYKTVAAELPEIAKKADDLEAIKKAVDDAASVSGALWFSYLFVLFYLAVAAGAVTHADLFLENPVKLPFLGVELPLVGFFFVAPLLFLIVHAYVFVHLVMLTEKAKRFHEELRKQFGKETGLPDDKTKDIRDGLRRQLPSNIFVQFLAGAPEARRGPFAFALRAIGWTTLVVGPVLLLLMMQIQFLPYHNGFVTWTQRFALLADLVLIWWLWGKILSGRETDVLSVCEADGRRRRTTWAWAGAALAIGACALLFSIVAAVVVVAWLLCVKYVFNRKHRAPGVAPDRVAGTRDDAIPGGDGTGAGFDRETNSARASVSWAWPGFGFALSAMALLFSLATASFPGEPQEQLFTGWPFVPAADHVGSQWAPQTPPRASSEAPSFGHPVAAIWRWLVKSEETDLHQWAFNSPPDPKTGHRWPFSNTLVLVGFDIYENLKVDDPEKLKRNSTFHARGRELRGAIFERANLARVDFAFAHLEGASLDGAILLGAQFGCDIILHDRSRGCAHLEGASLEGALLQGTLLHSAELKGATLDNAQLQGATLENAELQGASLKGAQLQGASLDRARLQGASLINARLGSASLALAGLFGASLEFASLQGASLDGAQLQGALLSTADLTSADLSNAYLWRTKLGSGKQNLIFAKGDNTTWQPVWADTETFPPR